MSSVQWMFLLAVILLFLFVGLFLEGIAAMLVLVPILHPDRRQPWALTRPISASSSFST